MDIFINRDGQRGGPYSLNKVNECLAEGSMKSADLAFHEGLTDWIPLSQIDGVVTDVEASAQSSEPDFKSVSEASIETGNKGKLQIFGAIGVGLVIVSTVVGLILAEFAKKESPPKKPDEEKKAENSISKPKQASVIPPASVPAFTLQDFDPNSSDHNATKKAIGAALGKSPANLTQEDLVKVEKLDLFAAGITDISPLAALSGLKRLDIVGNGIDDLRALTGLTSLEVLYACENKISDLTPLAGLSKLRVLHLRRNYVSDLTPLEGLSSMLSLDLERNRVKDIAPLSNLHELNWLALSFNKVSDISALAGAHNLRHLYLELNWLTSESDLSAFSKLRFLKTLSLRGNGVTDLSSLAGLDNMLWLELDNNRVDDLSPLTGMKGLKKLYMENNRVRILDPLVELTSLEIVQGKGNPASSSATRKLMLALPKCSVTVGSFNKVPTRRNRNPAPPEKK